MIAADFDNQTALSLTGIDQLLPATNRLPPNRRGIQYGIGRQFDRVHHPGVWNDTLEHAVGLFREVFFPEIL